MTDFRIAFAAVALAAAPGVATAQTTEVAAAAAQTAVVQPAQAAPAKRYCIVETPTGSRIPQKTCKTRDEWLSSGVDIPADR